MALAKMCDCCKKFYNHYDGFNGIQKLRVSVSGSITGTGARIDLCPDCMKYIERIVQNGTETKS